MALQVEIQSKYAGYIERQQTILYVYVSQSKRKFMIIYDYSRVSGLSLEVVQKLTQIKPTTIAQAGRISCVTPAALSLCIGPFKKAAVIGMTLTQGVRIHLEEGLKTAGYYLPVDPFVHYLELLHKWNKAYNLTAIRDPEIMVSRHILDSLAICPWIKGTRLIDVVVVRGYQVYL